MELAILRTVCYHDLFDYPLTLEEIHQFLIGEKTSLKEIQSIIKPASQDSFGMHQSSVISRGGFYFLKGREKIVSLRQRQERISKKKLAITKRIADWLRLIPTVKMIAITGTLAMKNAKKNDDIDLLIVTRADCLWLTRFLAVLLIELVANRPQLEEKKFKDAICLNIFLDERHLQMPKQKQNLFVAHEMAQMKLLWQKDDVYQKFTKKNRWVKKFLPNWKR